MVCEVCILAGGKRQCSVLCRCCIFFPLILSGRSFQVLVIPHMHVLTSSLLHALQFSGVVSLWSLLFLWELCVCLGFFGPSALSPQLMESMSCSRVPSLCCGLETLWEVMWAIIWIVGFLILRDNSPLCLENCYFRDSVRFPLFLSGERLNLVPVTPSWLFKPLHNLTGQDYYYPDFTNKKTLHGYLK